MEQDDQAACRRTARKNACFVELKKNKKPGASESPLTVVLERRRRHGTPQDGGFKMVKDDAGKPFVATTARASARACGSLREYMYDEPDSQAITVTVPQPLADVSEQEAAPHDRQQQYAHVRVVRVESGE